MCDFHSCVYSMADRRIYHLPSNSHSEIVQHYGLRENDHANRSRSIELEFSCLTHPKTIRDVLANNIHDASVLKERDIRKIIAHYTVVASVLRGESLDVFEKGGILNNISFLDVAKKVPDFDIAGWISSLPEGLSVGGSLYLSGTQITSLPEGLSIGGSLDLSGTQITSLPEGLSVGGKIYR